MRILVDGDSCPADRRILLLRASQRGVEIIFALHNPMRIKNPQLPLTLCKNVDSYLLTEARAHDVAITRDLPLAAQLLSKEVMVIDFCGRELSALYIAHNFAQREAAARAPFIAPQKKKSLLECRTQFAHRLDRLISSALAH